MLTVGVPLSMTNLQIEGPQLLQHGFNDAIAKVGLTKFVSDLFFVGLFYHLYNQVTRFHAMQNHQIHRIFVLHRMYLSFILM